MRETWKDRIVGGVIALLVAVIGAIIISWWDSFPSQSSIILYTTSDYTERTRPIDRQSGKQFAESEMFARNINFNNLRNDLNNFAIFIPMRSEGDAPIVVEPDQRNAVIRSISNPSEIMALGRIKIDIQSMEKGGKISLVVRSPTEMRDKIDEGPRADAKEIEIVSPSILHLFI